MQQVFPYYPSVAPALAILLGLALIETAVVHLVAVAVWGWDVAIVLGMLDMGLVLALAGLIRAMRRHPVTLDMDILVMRLGTLKVLRIPFSRIAGFRDSWDAAALKQRGVVNLAPATWPNVVIDLAPPIRWRGRDVHAVAHKLDDAAAFRAAVLAAQGAVTPRPASPAAARLARAPGPTRGRA